MSNPAADLEQDEQNNKNANGNLEEIGNAAEYNEGEESDDYEEIDDEEERGDEEEEDGGDKGQQNTLTHLLLGKPNGAPAENEAEYEEDEDDAEEGDDDEEDDDDEYVEDQDEDDVAPSISRKRSIDEVADKEASQGSKKLKA